MSDPVIDKTMATRIATQLGWEPKREWQGLTMEEVQEILTDPRYQMKPFIVHAVEAKLKEKNNDLP
jgi:hypothetical protein